MSEIKIMKYADHPSDFPEMKWISLRIYENGYQGDVEAYVSNEEIAELVIEEGKTIDDAIVKCALLKVKNEIEQVIANLASREPMVGKTVSLDLIGGN